MLEKISGGVEKRKQALALMRSALDLIDDSGGTADVGAHLDLAIRTLETALSRPELAQPSDGPQESSES